MKFGRNESYFMHCERHVIHDMPAIYYPHVVTPLPNGSGMTHSVEGLGRLFFLCDPNFH